MMSTLTSSYENVRQTDFFNYLHAKYKLGFKPQDSRFLLASQLNSTEDAVAQKTILWLGAIKPSGSSREFRISLPSPQGGHEEDSYWARNERGERQIYLAVRYVDYHKKMPELMAFQDERIGMAYFLFEEHVNWKGDRRVYLILPADKTAIPGIRIHNAEVKALADGWLKNMTDSITDENRFEVHIADEYADDFFWKSSLPLAVLNN